MSRLALAALGALLLPLAPVVAVAKAPPVMVEVVYQFTSPTGKAKTWKEYITVSSGEAAARDYCETQVPKPSKNLIGHYTRDYKALAGHTFVSAACTKKGGDWLISTGRIGGPNRVTPAGIGLYFQDKAGKVKTSFVDDGTGGMSMTQCLDNLKTVTSKYKAKIPKTIDEFAGMTFVKSECVFYEDFKL